MLAEIASRHRLPILGSALREIFGNLYLYTCNEFQDVSTEIWKSQHPRSHLGAVV